MNLYFLFKSPKSKFKILNPCYGISLAKSPFPMTMRYNQYVTSFYSSALVYCYDYYSVYSYVNAYFKNLKKFLLHMCYFRFKKYKKLFSNTFL